MGLDLNTCLLPASGSFSHPQKALTPAVGKRVAGARAGRAGEEQLHGQPPSAGGTNTHPRRGLEGPRKPPLHRGTCLCHIARRRHQDPSLPPPPVDVRRIPRGLADLGLRLRMVVGSALTGWGGGMRLGIPKGRGMGTRRSRGPSSPHHLALSVAPVCQGGCAHGRSTEGWVPAEAPRCGGNVDPGDGPRWHGACEAEPCVDDRHLPRGSSRGHPTLIPEPQPRVCPGPSMIRGLETSLTPWSA